MHWSLTGHAGAGTEDALSRRFGAELWAPYLRDTALRVFASVGLSGQVGRFTRPALDYTAGSGANLLDEVVRHFLQHWHCSASQLVQLPAWDRTPHSAAAAVGTVLQHCTGRLGATHLCSAHAAHPKPADTISCTGLPSPWNV